MHMRRTADRLLGDDYEWSILEALNFEIATPDEARQMLQLKGRGNVGF